MIYQDSIFHTWALRLLSVTPFPYADCPRLPLRSRVAYPMRKGLERGYVSQKPSDISSIGLLKVLFHSKIQIFLSSNIILVPCTVSL